MAKPLALVWDLIATDNASAVFARVGNSAEVNAAKTAGLGDAFLKMSGIVAVAAAGIAVVTTKMAANYQEATTLLTTGAGESVANIDMIRQGLLDMAPAVGIGPTALAKAMFLVESAGYHGAAGLTVMNAAAQGAKIGGADATVVADGLTTAMTDYHFATDQAALVTSKLVATVALGKTNMGDLSAAMSTVLPFAANLKVSFNDVMGAMATMTGQGIDAATSATMLKFGMMSLSNETPKGKKALASIGLTAQQVVTDMGTKGLSGTLTEITAAIGKKFPAGSAQAVAALSAIVGGTRGMGMALALTGQNAATMTANVASIAGAVTEADGSVKGWTLTQEDLNTQLAQVGAFFSSVGIKLGTVLIPWVLKGTEAFRTFAAEFQNGTGAGGKFRDVLVEVNDRALKPTAAFITGTVLPTLEAIATWIQDKGVPGFQSFIQWVQAAKVPLEIIGSFITATLLPLFTVLAVDAVESAIKQAGAWAMAEVASVKSAATMVAAGWAVVGGWMQSAAAAVASGAETVAIWTMLAADSIKKAAIVAVAWVGSTAGLVAAWTTSAAETVALWFMLQWDAVKKAAIVAASWVGSVAGVVVAWVATNAVIVAGWIATAAVAMASGIQMAAAWVIGLGPIAWIIAGVVAIGAGMVWLYNNVSWFKDGVDFLWKGISLAFTDAWNLVIQPVLTFLVGALVNVMTTFGNMLVVLGTFPNMGWAKDAGDKVLAAAGAVAGFKDSIKKLDGTTASVAINVTANYSAAVATVLGGARAAIKLAGLPGAANGGTFDPTPGGTAIRVAEAGRRETVVDTASLNRAMAQRNTPQATPNVAVYVQAIPDGEYVRQEAMVAINGAATSATQLGRQAVASR